VVENSDPASTTDARDPEGDAASATEWALIWVTGTLAGSPLALPWAGSYE
jgi:hypothetical protein